MRSFDAIKVGRKHAADRRVGLGLGAMYELHQAGDLTGSCVFVDDALRGNVADGLDSIAQVGGGSVEIALADGLAYFFDRGTHRGFPVAVACAALEVLTPSFQGRLAVGHVLASPILFFSYPRKQGLFGDLFFFFPRVDLAQHKRRYTWEAGF